MLNASCLEVDAPARLMDLLDQVRPAEVRRIELTCGGVLADAASPATHVYFVESGQLRVHHDAPRAQGGRLLEILGPGDWLGGAALAGRPTMGRRVVAASATVVRAVAVDALLTVMCNNPAAAAALTRELAAKLQDACDAGSELIFDDCRSRLLKALVRMSSGPAAEIRSDGVVLRITHEQLAQAIGVARETVSLTLGQLRINRLLRTGRNQLVFDPQMLRQLIENPPVHRELTAQAG